MAFDGKTLGLALSGGGFRATLFGLGSLWRLNDAGLLGKLDRITSVSGGSILLGIVAQRWRQLQFDDGRASNFSELIAEPVKAFCGKTIDVGAGLAGLLVPFKTAGDFLADRYEKDLFGKVMLKDLPVADGRGNPKFIFYATNLQTGRSFRFRQDMIADYRLGISRTTNVPLAVAVAASSAFPPIFSPIVLNTDPAAWTEGDELPNLHALRKRIVLTDGGVYDNMGLESLVDNVEIALVSDAGAPFEIDEAPARDAIFQLGRVRDILIDQTRALRKRWLITEFEAGRQHGAYWGIDTRMASYSSTPRMTGDSAVSNSMAHVPTRLGGIDAERQGHLINWGYALCDVSLRARVVTHLPPATSWPQPEWALSSDRSIDLPGLPEAAMPAAIPRMTARAEPPGDDAERVDAEQNRQRLKSVTNATSTASKSSEDVGARQTKEGAAAHEAVVSRYVQQKSFCKPAGKFVEERAGYRVGQPVMVQVFIGPRRADSIAAPEVFPEDKLPKNRDTHRLQIVFHEPRQFDQPMLDEILLRRLGDSSAASFVFTPRAEGDFEGRISVLHRGRVLQTVLLHTGVSSSADVSPGTAPGITLDDEARVRHDWSDLGQRRQFDLAIVLNHTATGTPLLTGITGKRAWATHLEGIEQPVRKLNELISAVAHSVADYGDGLDQGENPALLVKLARVGANLYSLLYRDQLKLMATDAFDVGDDKVTYLQVISARPDAIVPLEFMYDFNAPDPGATVCPQHREALAKGRCPDNCARVSQPRAHVCPMGFWGLKKVIERHIFDPKATVPAGAQVVLQIEAIEGRDRLDLSAGALVGYSKEVKPAEVASLVKALGTKLHGRVPIVKDWDEWMATVKTRHPALLVAFPHNEGKEEDVLLEIGGKKLYTLDLPVDYVHTSQGPPPLVFLLGCDVAGTAQDFSSHIRYFRQAGAAVVVSTIATVFGAHAVRVGKAIVSGLLTSGAPGTVRIGEVIRDAKRAALLDSVPMALCVVAFGDADWRL